MASPWLSRGTLLGPRSQTPQVPGPPPPPPSSSLHKLLPRRTAPPPLGPLGVAPSPPPPLASKPLRPGTGYGGLSYVLPGARKPALPEVSDRSWQHTRRGAGACSPPTGHRAWQAPRSSRLPPASLTRAPGSRPPSPHRLQQGVRVVQLLLAQPSLHLQFAHDALKTLQPAAHSTRGSRRQCGPPASRAVPEYIPSCRGPPCPPAAHS